MKNLFDKILIKYKMVEVVSRKFHKILGKKKVDPYLFFFLII